MNKTLLLLSFFYLVQACATHTKETVKKDYIIYVDTSRVEGITLNDSQNLVQTVHTLIREFNADMGFEALKYTTNRQANINSVIHFRRGIYDPSQNKHEVGTGQWTSIVTQHSQFHLTHKTVKKNVELGMNIAIDFDWFNDRAGSAVNSAAFYDMKKLFYHEVGHGLHMDHTSNPADVMYHEINGEKDFSPFAERVKAFFND